MTFQIVCSSDVMDELGMPDHSGQEVHSPASGTKKACRAWGVLLAPSITRKEQLPQKTELAVPGAHKNAS